MIMVPLDAAGKTDSKETRVEARKAVRRLEQSSRKEIRCLDHRGSSGDGKK